MLVFLKRFRRFAAPRTFSSEKIGQVLALVHVKARATLYSQLKQDYCLTDVCCFFNTLQTFNGVNIGIGLDSILKQNQASTMIYLPK